jgi:hypothetical protein
MRSCAKTALKAHINNFRPTSYALLRTSWLRNCVRMAEAQPIDTWPNNGPVSNQLVGTKSRLRKPDVVVGAAYMQQCRSSMRLPLAQATRPPGSQTWASKPSALVGW